VWSRRLFAAGGWVLVALGLVHLLGHYQLVTAEGADETQRQLLALMRSYERDFGAGFVRSTMELLTGFSLAFSTLTLGIGLLDLTVLRYSAGWTPLLRGVAIVNAGIFGVMTAMALRYWFVAPLLFLVLAFLCFVGALARELSSGRTGP
jgi:hypothetical protein